ncbi:MAG: TIGR02253 family HAD-type hydrolase [Candidatus Lokiarchaeota archaeon]|jgi:putative hydrolase of the HAD superfamily|nr:TIGR02253 family HAD-type hydrolase [Candidatus Lokiarchaeota archaeon]
MCPIKLVGFDLDDCLYNSTGLSQIARIKGIDAMISLGLNIERQKALFLLQEIVTEYGSNSSKHYDYFIRRLNQYENFSISFNEQIRYEAAAVMAYHAQKIKLITLYDDVKKSLEKLKENSIKTAIITDGIPIKQYEKILRLGIDDLIDLVVISDEVGIRKPNPKLFSYCLNKFKVKGHETIYVGDNIYKDIVPAKLNEIHSVYIHRGGKYDTNITGEEIAEENKPDYEISKLDEIFDIINDLNKKFYIGKV